MANIELRVELPNDRSKTGRIKLVDTLTGLVLYGPKPILGRASQSDATANGNPTRNATMPYGNTPTGTYTATQLVKTGDGTGFDAVKYGSSGAIRLNPQSGEAELAKANGRTGLLIHAGRQPAVPSAPVEAHLRPTNGCLRMIEADLKGLMNAIQNINGSLPADLVESAGQAGPQGGPDASANEGDPPPPGGLPLPMP